MTKEQAERFIVQSIKDDVDVAEIADAIMTLEQAPCDDAISRQVVLDMMQIKMGAKELYKAVYELPSVIPQPKTGHYNLKAIKDNCINRSRCKGCTYLNNDTLCCRFHDIPLTWEIE